MGELGVVIFVGPFADLAVVEEVEDGHQGIVRLADTDVDDGGLCVSVSVLDEQPLVSTQQYIWTCGHDLFDRGECPKHFLSTAVLLPFFIIPSDYNVRAQSNVVCLDCCLLSIIYCRGRHDVLDVVWEGDATFGSKEERLSFA